MDNEKLRKPKGQEQKKMYEIEVKKLMKEMEMCRHCRKNGVCPRAYHGRVWPMGDVADEKLLFYNSLSISKL